MLIYGTRPTAGFFLYPLCASNKLKRHSDPEQAGMIFDKYKPTHVIHLAALGTSCACVLKSPLTVSGSRWPISQYAIQGRRMRPPQSQTLIFARGYSSPFCVTTR